jgi:hypothetical protein
MYHSISLVLGELVEARKVMVFFLDSIPEKYANSRYKFCTLNSNLYINFFIFLHKVSKRSLYNTEISSCIISSKTQIGILSQK